MSGRLSLTLLVCAAALGAAGSTATGAAHPANFPSLRPVLTVKPQTVRPGEIVVFSGSGFLPSRRVSLLIGPPNAEAQPFASASTDSRGNFRKRYRIGPRARRGQWIVLACQRECRVKASARLRIV